MTSLLDSIRSPEDLRSMDVPQLEELAEEIRRFVVSVVSDTGGHLAPSLGVVELTLALHSVFETPKDKIVWDVGHQAYVHKIITGRKDQFHTLRQYGGLSGFPKIRESDYDAFGVGHASTAISAALGLAVARDLKRENHRILAVVGDGAMSGGLAFEGLNNAGGLKRDLVVVLNDNRMSISPNVGALSRYLNQLITAPLYNKIKTDLWTLTGKLPRGSARIREVVQRIEEGLKAMVVPGLLFERLGFRYFGPIDGHDISKMVKVFQEIKRLHGPILVHVITKKGKGYRFAEEDATKFHGLGAFCQETGHVPSARVPTYTEVFGRTLVQLAEKDPAIVGITAAMADGTGMIHLSHRFPERFFDVGIAQAHAVTFAAGMALSGFKPVVAMYSTFLQRAFDQIIHDVALQEIPVVFAVDRSGLVGEDGPTHHGQFDLSYLRLIPHLVVMAPRDENELRDMLWTALHRRQGPSVIRFPRGEGYGHPPRSAFRILPIGKGEIVREGRDGAVLAIGDRVEPALAAAGILEQHGISLRVVNMRFIKPIDRTLVLDTSHRFSTVMTLENNTVIGGFGSAVAEILAEQSDPKIRFRRLGLPDQFVTHGCLPKILEETGLDVPHLVKTIRAFVGTRPHRHRHPNSTSGPLRK